MHKKYLAVLIGAVGATLSGQAALAQEAADRSTTRLEEVIVSATKRDDMVQDVPASIAVMTDSRLKEAAIDSAADLQRALPGISYKEGGDSRNSSLSVRGIGTIAFSDAIDPSVGVVMDGVVLGRQSSALSNFSDVQRVEVLRGPQGTLFGMNSSAGVLNIVTKDPTSELTGEFGIGYGSYNEIKVNGAISGPLIDGKLLGRLSLYSVERDGYIYNRFNGEHVNDDDQKGVRGKLLFTPRDSTRLTLNLDYVEQDRNCCAQIVRDPDALGAMLGLGGHESDVLDAASRYGNKDRNRGISLQWDEEIGDYTLTSITAARSANAANPQEFNLAPFRVLTEQISRIDQDQLSQELRIASPVGETVDYVAGLFVFDQSLNNRTDQVLDLGALAPLAALGIPLPPPLGFPVTLFNHDNADIDTLNYAAFGEANFNVTDELTLIAGARWTHIDMDFRKEAQAFGLADFSGSFTDSLTDSNISWRLGARWQFTPDHMTYATVARGYKGPGFNATSGNGTSQQVAPEISTNFELGLKSRFLGDRVRTNLSAFLTKFDDFQAQGVDYSTGNPQFMLVNAGKLTSKGVEFEIDAVPIPNLTVHANMAYIKAEFDEFPGAQCYPAQGCATDESQDLAGKPLPGAPKKTFAINANYDILLDSLPFDAFVRADYSWRDKVVWQLSQDPQSVEDAYGLFGAAFGIRGRDQKYTVTVFGKNLTDEFHTSGINAGYVLPFAGGQSAHFLPVDYKPFYGIALDYRFD